jgi:hypothetical protein
MPKAMNNALRVTATRESMAHTGELALCAQRQTQVEENTA